MAINQEKRRAYLKRYAQEHATEIRQRRREHRVEKSEYNRRYHAEHRAEIRKQREGYEARYRKEHRATLALKQRLYRQKTGRDDRKYLREYYRENREVILAQQKLYYEEHKEDYNAYSRARRARLRGAPGSHTKEDIHGLFEQQGRRCVTCRAEITEESGPLKYHVDHIVALISDGSNSIDNIQLLCKRCNLTKNKRDIREWAAEHGFTLPDKLVATLSGSL